MIVVDASAMTELLLQTPVGSHVEARLFRDGDDFHAPHLLDMEVVQALRRLVRAGEVLPGRAQEAVEDLVLFDVLRHSHVDLLGRAWELSAPGSMTRASSSEVAACQTVAPAGASPPVSSRAVRRRRARKKKSQR